MRLIISVGLLCVAAFGAPAMAQLTMTCEYASRGNELVFVGADWGNHHRVPAIGQRLETSPGNWAYLMDNPDRLDGSMCPQRLELNSPSSAGTTLGGSARLDYSLEPAYGTYTLNSGFTPDPYRINVWAGGYVDVSEATDGQCAGFAAAAPDVRLNFQDGNYNEINFSALSDSDTMLVINDPNGEWYCDDDSGGNLNPLLSFTPISGQYDIWVGTFSPPMADARLASATLAISELPYNPDAGVSETSLGGGPDYSLEPTFGSFSLSSGFLPDPYEVNVVAGGDIEISAYTDGQCAGFVASAPDVRLEFADGFFDDLIFSVNSTSDTTLIINDPEGNWYCDDDSGNSGLNPSLSLTPMRGQYDIWVGTYGSSTANASLAISELYSH